jgi:hypothetical protein
MLAWPLGIGVAGQRGPWLKMGLRGGGARMAWASELGALPVDFPATMQHDASPDRTAQRSLPAVLSGHAWSGVVPFATFVAMACKGSGVQIPSAPPPNPRSDDTTLVRGRRGVTACCQQVTARQLPNRASDCAGHMWFVDRHRHAVAAAKSIGSSAGVPAGGRRPATVRQTGPVARER